MPIDDRRKDKSDPWGFVVFQDRFLSGWGMAKHGLSLVALPVNDDKEAQIVLENGENRSDMFEGRFVGCLDEISLDLGDHLAVFDRNSSARWYVKDGF